MKIEEVLAELDMNHNDYFLLKAGCTFDQFYNKFEKKIKYFISNKIKNYNTNAIDMSATDEIVADTFVSAYFHIHQYDNTYNISTWLYTIGKNMAYQFKMKHAKRMDSEKLILYDINSSGTELINIYADMIPMDSNDDDIEYTSDVILDAINKLPKKYKEILTMREIDEISYYDISNIFNINISTVKSNIRKARGILREKLIIENVDI